MVRIGTPISSSPRASTGGRLLLGVFFSVFFAIGGAFLYSGFGKPIARIVSAGGWQSTSCHILESGVHTNRDSDGDTYRVAVRYQYEVGGRAYAGDRYKFMGGSSSGYGGKADIVARLAPGTRTACYYNPADPSDAVIERGFTPDLLFGLIPLVFVAVGVGGIYAAVAGGRSPRWTKAVSGAPRRPSGSFIAFEQTNRRPRPTLLKPRHQRRAKVLGLVFFAVVWNGIVWVAIQDGPVTLFMIPFVLIGIGVVIVAVRHAMQLANPTPLITVGGAAILLGEEFKLTWAIDGKASVLRNLRIDLEGREEATYRRGTDTTTDVEVFAKLPLVNASAPVSAAGGVAKLTIPAGTMHSFEARNNKIVWLLRVHGEIPSWPDSDEEFPLEVGPRRS